jgi:hypothetical protein
MLLFVGDVFAARLAFDLGGWQEVLGVTLVVLSVVAALIALGLLFKLYKSEPAEPDIQKAIEQVRDLSKRATGAKRETASCRSTHQPGVRAFRRVRTWEWCAAGLVGSFDTRPEGGSRSSRGTGRDWSDRGTG